MRILYHHRTQGAEPESVHIAAIAAALGRLRHTIDIVGPTGKDPRGGSSKQSLLGRIKRKTPRLLVELIQIIYNPVSFGKLLHALLRRRYDFLYERYALYNVAGLFAARLFAKPFVLEVNTLYARAWQQYFGLWLGGLARALERYTVRSADAVITVSDALRVLLEQEGVEARRITVLPNAIDPREFDPTRFEGSDLRNKLGLAPIVAGFVGTMMRWQGVTGFADVVEQVTAARDDVSFLFVGDGESRGALQLELSRRGVGRGVTFVGRQPHAAIPEYIAAMDIGLLLDSNSYGSPMKVFEYWAMGKAVIAPTVPPVLEVMRDGQTGLLIAPGDAAAMVRNILLLAGDAELRVRLGQAGRRAVLAAHTWDRNAGKILDSVSALGLVAADGMSDGAV